MNVKDNILLVDSLDIDEMTKGIGTVILNFLKFSDANIYVYQISECSITLETDQITDDVKGVTIFIEKSHLEMMVQVGCEYYIKEDANLEDVSVTFSNKVDEIKKRFNKV